MNEKEGRVFSIVDENSPVAGCTVAKKMYEGNDYYIYHFSLAAETSISPESYDYPKLIIVVGGVMDIFTSDGRVWSPKKGDGFLIDEYFPYGMKTHTGCVYTEITLRKETKMNKIIEAGQVFALKELLPYKEDKIVNMDIIDDEKLKFVLMSFDEGTGLSEHAAPGEALIFVLEGKGIIGYEGKEYVIRQGENFKFAEGGAHYVKAHDKFKMALMLILK